MSASAFADRSPVRHMAGVATRIVAAGVLSLGCLFAGAQTTSASTDALPPDPLSAPLTDGATSSGDDDTLVEVADPQPTAEPSTAPTPEPMPEPDATAEPAPSDGATISEAKPAASEAPATTDALASEPATAVTEDSVPAPVEPLGPTVPAATAEPLPVTVPSVEASPAPPPSSEPTPAPPPALTAPVEKAPAQPTDSQPAPEASTPEAAAREPEGSTSAPSLRASDATMIDGDAVVEVEVEPQAPLKVTQRPQVKRSKGLVAAPVPATVVQPAAPLEECVLEIAVPDAPESVTRTRAFIPHGPDPVVAGGQLDATDGFDGPMSVIDEAAVSSAGFILAPRVSSAVAVAMDFAKAGSGWAGPLVFNVWLRRQMRERRMSQRQLGLQSGVNHSTISRLLTGHRSPSLETATRLVHALRMEWTDDQVATYFDLLPEQTLMPTQRVESALRGDGALDDDDIRAVMNRYLVLRARRRRMKAGASPTDPIDIARASGEP